MRNSPPSSPSRSRARDPRWRWLLRFAAAELLRTLGLILATALAVGVLVHYFFEEGRVARPAPAPAVGEAPAQPARHGLVQALADFLANGHLNRNGVPLWGSFSQAVVRTGPILLLAVGLMTVGAIVAGGLIVLRPELDWLRVVILGLSAVPSFVVALAFTSAHSASPTVRIIAAAIALAVGDLNLYAVTTAFSESLRYELARPHVRLLRALGRTVWLDVWPRSLVVILEAVSARVPHFLGGSIALEFLFNLDGLGNLAWRSLVETPPDYHAVLWVCALGIIVSRLINVGTMFVRAWLSPELLASSAPSDDADQLVSPPTSASAAEMVGSDEAGIAPEPLPELCEPIPPTPGWLGINAWPRRVRYYLRLNPAHYVTLTLYALLAIGLVWFMGPIVQRAVSGVPRSGEALAPYEHSSRAHPWGTNGNGVDVVDDLARGLAQQAPPLTLAILACVALAPLAMAASIAQLARRGIMHWVLRGLAFVFDGVSELLEAIPKLVIVLACVTLFSSEAFVLKIYLTMGLIHAPQMYRAIRDELAAVSQNAFLEGLLTSRVPLRRIVAGNLLWNHTLHVVIIQAVLLAASIVHLDALLGFVGVRNRGEIFTWGSILGMGVEESLNMQQLLAVAPDIQFNSGVFWAPLTAVWLSVVCMFALADVLKLLLGGYIHRLH